MTEPIVFDDTSVSSENNFQAVKVNNFRAQNVKTAVLIILFSIVCIMSIAAVVSEIAIMSNLEKLINGSGTAEEINEGVANIYKFVDGLQSIVFIPALIIFLFWNYSAYKNLETLNTGCCEHSPWWVVISYFVPIVFLYMPYKHMRQIWKGSDPNYTDPVGWMDAPSSLLVLFWWLAFLIKTILDFTASAWHKEFPSAESLYTYMQIKTLADFTEIFSAVFFVLVIINISRRQKLKMLKLMGIDANAV